MLTKRGELSTSVVVIIAIVAIAIAYVSFNPSITGSAGRPCGSPTNPCPPVIPPPGPVLYEFNGTAGDSFGSGVAFGDVNNDGTPDVIIGAENANSGAGYVKVFNGANISEVLYQFNGNAGDFFGARIATGDVNNDNKSDIAVGAYGVDVGANVDAGAIRVFDGATGSQIYQLDGTTTGNSNFLGTSVALGDVTGDGKDDILAGAWGGGLTGGPGYVRLFNGADGALLAQFDGYENNDEMGRGVAFGDVNGDGTLDLILGAGNSFGTWKGGYIRVINGLNFSQILYEFGALTKATKPEPDFGYAVASADLNSDGKDEMVVSAYRGKTGNTRGDATGYVRVFNGADAALLYQVTGSASSDEFGRGLTVGDVTGDNIKDVVVGASGNPSSSAALGYVRVYNGINGAFLIQYNSTFPAGLYGRAVATADIDGTGKDNVMVGSYYSENVRIYQDIS